MLTVHNLSCRRSRNIVFRDVSFDLASGEVAVVLGANGSGKSSLLRVLAGLLPCHCGQITWRGQSGIQDTAEYRRAIHYLGHSDGLKPERTVGETIDYWRSLACAETCDMTDPFAVMRWRDRPVRLLSAGQKRRLALSRLAFSFAPLWLLDEPLTALDREGQDLFMAMLAAHREKGGIAVMATHHERDVDRAKNIVMGEA